MAKKIYLQENLLLDIPPATSQFNSGVAGTGTVDLAKWITDASADGTITVTGSVSAGVASVNTRTGAVTLAKADVGLSNVDNTTDANKPISSATQTALNAKQATLVSGTNIKTVGGTSLVGSGDVPFPSTTNTLTATGAAITSTVNGTAATVTPASGTIQDTLGFNSSGVLVKQVVSGGGGTAISQYSAGANVLVTSYGTGITASKSSGVWTITVPSGVIPIDMHITVNISDVQSSADAGGVTGWIRIDLTGAGFNSGATVGTYRFPMMQTFLIPDTGTIAAGNAVATNNAAYAVIAVGANSMSLRKSGTLTNNTVLTLTGF